MSVYIPQPELVSQNLRVFSSRRLCNWSNVISVDCQIEICITTCLGYLAIIIRRNYEHSFSLEKMLIISRECFHPLSHLWLFPHTSNTSFTFEGLQKVFCYKSWNFVSVLKTFCMTSPKPLRTNQHRPWTTFYIFGMVHLVFVHVNTFLGGILQLYNGWYCK